MSNPVTIPLPAEHVAWLRQLLDDTRVHADRLAFDYAGQPGQHALNAFVSQRDIAYHATVCIAAIDRAEGRPNAVAEALANIAAMGRASHA